MKKSGKIILIGLTVLIFIGIIGGIVFLNNFTIFSSEENLLDSCKTKEGYSIEAYYVATGATTNDVVQIRRKDEKGYTLLKAFENYNKAEISLINDTTAKVILRFTSEGRPDTVLVNIRK